MAERTDPLMAAQARADFLETWGRHCGASIEVFAGHVNKLLEATRADERLLVAGKLRERWTFNDAQEHTHTWHSREDFIEELLAGTA